MPADNAMRCLCPVRELRIFRLRFGLDDGKISTVEEVGEAFGITAERVRQIESKTRAMLVPPQLYRTPDGLGVIEWIFEDGIRRMKVTRSRRAISIVSVDDAVEVLDFEKLWTMVTEIQHSLETEQHSLDVTDKVATGVSDALGVIGVRLRTDTRITCEEMDLWQNLLSPYGAKWTDRYGNSWVPRVREGRF